MVATNHARVLYQENIAQEVAHERQTAGQDIRVIPGEKNRPSVERSLRQDRVVSTMVVICLLVSAFIYLNLIAQTVGVNRQLSNAERKIEEIQNQTLRAEWELGQMASLARIEEYASENLNMIYPSADDIYYLSEQTSRAIAEATQGLNGDTKDAEAETQAAADHPFWQSIATMLGEFFAGSNEGAL